MTRFGIHETLCMEWNVSVTPTEKEAISSGVWRITENLNQGSRGDTFKEALACLVKHKGNVGSKFQIMRYQASTFTVTFMETADKTFFCVTKPSHSIHTNEEPPLNLEMILS